MGLPGGRLFRGFYRNSQNGCIDGMVRLITPTTSVFSYGAEPSVISLFYGEDEALNWIKENFVKFWRNDSVADGFLAFWFKSRRKLR